MKKILENIKLHRILLFSLTFIALLVMWYIKYPYFLVWLEGFSYFSTLADFQQVHFNLPSDLLRYAASFVLQFYANPLVAAATQALLALVFVLMIWDVKGIVDQECAL